jgi:hypothetical protein
MPRFFTPTIGRNTLAVLAVSVPCLASCGGDKPNGQITPGAGGAFGAAGSSPSGGNAATTTNGGAPAPGMGGSATPSGGVPGGPGGGGTPGGGGIPTGMGGTVGGGGAAGSSGTTNGGAAGMGGGGDGGGPTKPYVDPGTGAWEEVPKADVLSVCKLDPDKLTAAGTTLNVPWAIVRYGKVCWEHNAKNFAPTEAYSTTKTLGATVTGMVSYQTRMIPRTGKKTGQLSDEDMASQWLDSQTYNQQAKVAHVLGMVAHDANLAYGSKTFAYDTVGATEINTLSTMINNAVAQDTARLGANIEEFTKKFLYAPLGMTKSVWGGGATTKVFAYTWSTDVYDMLRVGLLLVNNGMWAGQRLIDEQWVYRMTHPSFEDANTGFGYLTWLNSASNWCSIDGVKKQGAYIPGTCAPVAIHKSYPHGVSEAKDCGYTAPATCDQKYDVGVFQAEGLGGQLIQGHRGLDIVIVARNAQPGGTGPGTAKTVWDAIRPAVIAGDPMFKGDEAAFCKAYGSNDYAPDMH